MKKCIIISSVILASLTNFAQISPDGQLIHLSLNNDSEDISCSRYNTGLTDITYTADRFNVGNNAAVFNATSSYIELNNNKPVLDSGAFSVSAWFRILGEGGGLSKGNAIFTQRNDATVRDMSEWPVLLNLPEKCPLQSEVL